MKNLITLMTDFGLKDHYTGVMKGVILGINPDATIIDITHCVDTYNIIEASLRLMNYYSFFPEGTVHVVTVDPGVGAGRRPIAVQAGGFFFVGPDNGVFSLIYRENEAQRIIEIANRKYMLKDVSNTFHGRDIFAPAAAHISSGLEIHKLGNDAASPVLLDIPKPSMSKDEVLGEVIYEDHFGNLVTNISGKLVGKGSKVYVGRVRIDRISESYGEAGVGGLLALIGSSGLLEISANQGSAREVLNAEERLIRVILK